MSVPGASTTLAIISKRPTSSKTMIRWSTITRTSSSIVSNSSVFPESTLQILNVRIKLSSSNHVSLIAIAYVEKQSARESTLADGYSLKHNPEDDKIYCLLGNQTRKYTLVQLMYLYRVYSGGKNGSDPKCPLEASYRRLGKAILAGRQTTSTRGRLKQCPDPCLASSSSVKE